MSNIMLARKSNGQYTNLKVDTNGALECNVGDVELHAGDIVIAVDGLEGLQGTNNALCNAIDGRMDSIIGATNNTASIGDGQNQLKAVCLGYDRGSEKARSILVDSGGVVGVHDTLHEVSTAAFKAANHADLVQLETTLTEIATSVQALDNAVDGSHLNINHNIAGTDVAANSGNKSAQTQRVVIATDDIPIALINTNLGTINSSVGTSNGHLNNIVTAVQALDNAVDGDYFNVNQNIAGTDVAANSGNKSAQTQRVVIATDDIPTGLTNTILNAVNGSIGTGNTALGAIKTAVELLDNALDGNYLNVNANIGGADFAVNSGNKDSATQRVVIATDDIPIALVNTNLGTVNSSVGTVNSSIGTANGHLNNIVTAVQLLDNALDGNYLNVNANIGGADFAVNSGNKDTATQRVCVATDDVPFTTLNTHLSEIEDAVETLQACVDSNKVKVQFEAGDLNIGNVDVVSSVLPSGASTESTLGSMSAKLPATLGQKANANCISTCRSSTAGAYDMSGRTTIGTAGTTTKLLCDSAGHLQVDVVSGGGSTDVSALSTHAKQDVIIGHVDGIEGLIGTTNSGLSSIDGGISDLDTLLGDIQTDSNNRLDHLSGDLDTLNGKIDTLTTRIKLANSDAHIAVSLEDIGGVATQTTVASILAKNTEIETTADAILAKNTEIETTADAILAKNTEIETTADAILAKNTEMETSLNALISANHTDLVALETTLTEIAPRHAVATLSDAANLADGAALAIVDTNGYRYMTIFGKATNSFELTAQYSTTNSASKMISLYLQDMGSEDVNNINVFHKLLEHPARYVRLINYSGSQANALTLYYQLSN